MAVSPDDWRYEQLLSRDYLKGLAWVWTRYRPYREGWDHDHCCACWKTFAPPEVMGDGILHEGFATTDDYVRGAEYEWVCKACFNDFSALMAWRDVTPQSSLH